MSQARYQVGQVLYVLDVDRQRIVPIQICKETVHTTMKGQELEYEIVTPAKPDRPISLSNVKGEIHESLDKLQQIMQKNAFDAISAMVTRAAMVADQNFAIANPMHKTQVESDPLASEPDLGVPLPAATEQRQVAPKINGSKITLPNGDVVEVELPPVPPLLEKPAKKAKDMQKAG